MGLLYTRKKDEDTEKTVNASEFIDRLLDLENSKKDKNIKEEPKTEILK